MKKKAETPVRKFVSSTTEIHPYWWTKIYNPDKGGEAAERGEKISQKEFQLSVSHAESCCGSVISLHTFD